MWLVILVAEVAVQSSAPIRKSNFRYGVLPVIIVPRVPLDSIQPGCLGRYPLVDYLLSPYLHLCIALVRKSLVTLKNHFSFGHVVDFRLSLAKSQISNCLFLIANKYDHPSDNTPTSGLPSPYVDCPLKRQHINHVFCTLVRANISVNEAHHSPVRHGALTSS